MPIIYSYPLVQTADLVPADRLIISKMDTQGDPTKCVSLQSLTAYISTSITPPPAVIPWPYQYDSLLQTFIQGANPGATGSENTGYGNPSLLGLTSGDRNTAIGEGSGGNLTQGNNNVFVGFDIYIVR